MNKNEVLELIQESALTLDTTAYPDLARLFIAFYQEKDKDINGALERLNFALGQYQFENQFQGPGCVSKIRLAIKETQNLRHGAGLSALMFPIWY